jgi:hypothetical protein
MTVRSGRSMSADYISKPRPQGHVADHVDKGHVADHVSKGHIWQTTSAKHMTYVADHVSKDMSRPI